MADNILELTGMAETSDIIEDLIEEHQLSKSREDVIVSKRYYDGDNDILGRKFNEFDVDGEKMIDENRADDKLANNYMEFGVDQKVGYITGKPITLKSNNKALIKAIEDTLGLEFDMKMGEWVTEASHGVAYLHPYVDKNLDFKYRVYNTEDVIPIKDTEFEEEIVQFIRYYPMIQVDNDNPNLDLS